MKRFPGMAASLAIMGVLATGTAGTAVTEPRAQSEQPRQEGPAAAKPAAVTGRPRVVRDVLATAVLDREPTKAPSPIPPEVGRIYYFTEIVEVGPPMTLLHIWYWRNRYISAVLLKVKGSHFRTWSYKTIPRTWTGVWRVEARMPDGTILSSKTFLVETVEGTGDGGVGPRR